MSRAAAKSTRPADRRKLIIYAVVAVVIIAIVVAVGLASKQVVPNSATTSVGNSQLKAGDKAPPFAVQTDAGPFDLNGVSTPVLLEVFATWCPHCQYETRILNDLAAKYQGKLAIVAVSGDAFDINHANPESQADVNLFAQQFHVRYPIAYDPDLKVAQSYLQTGFPTMALITPSKTIAWIASGQMTEPELTKQINKVLR